ncbi:hypothetical protein [Peribacillus muralis]
MYWKATVYVQIVNKKFIIEYVMSFGLDYLKVIFTIKLAVPTKW